jgi:hypothetical protein
MHYVVIESQEVRPLCGDWAGSTNWTLVPGAVTCPRCRELLAHRRRADELAELEHQA